MSSKPSSARPTPQRTDLPQARLRGPSLHLDPRVNAFRADLADLALSDRLVAPRYSAGVAMRCTAPAAPMRAAASECAMQTSELLFGEGFTVFDRVGGWAWGQGHSDSYVGWVASGALAPHDGKHCDRVTAPQGLLFEAPALKAPVRAVVPCGAFVELGDTDGDYRAAGEGAWIHHRHVAPPHGFPVDTAHAFLGTPYRWGGRTRAGIDCSGLVQAALGAHGIACPRDTDQQQAAFAPIDPTQRARGDLFFVPGHVAMFVDATTLLHANAWWMSTVVEPLEAVLNRLGSRDFAVARPPCGRFAAPL